MSPRLFLLLPALLSVCGGNVSAAFAGWSSDPALIKGTLNSIPRISSCSDGGTGTFVFWYEENAPGQGQLFAQHVLVTGDLDLAWPAAGLLLGCGSGPLPLIGTLPDRAGGFYAWWNDGQYLRVLRLTGTAQVANNWDPCGIVLGVPDAESPLPCFVEDGAQGFYAAWVEGAHDPPIPAFVHSVSGTPFEEWPQGGILRGDLKAYWPRIATAPDGGVYVGAAFWSPDSIHTPGDYRLYKFTGDFADYDPAWPSAGLSFGRFHRELMGEVAGGLLDVCPDGRGGAFFYIGHVVGGYGLDAIVGYRVYRVTGSGQSAIDWPTGGVAIGSGWFWNGMPPEGSVRVFSDGLDGVHPGNLENYTDTPMIYAVDHLGPSGQSLPGGLSNDLVGHDVFAKGNGGLCMAAFSPHGPTGPYQPNAFISFQQTMPGNGFSEWDPTPSVAWYGAVAVAPTSDGAVFFWSQVRNRYGLFARKFGPTGQVTGVGKDPVELGLRLFFRVGEGVHARWSMAAPLPARLELFDITGRRRAQARLETATGQVDIVLPATLNMAPGVYFARLTTRDRSSRQRLVLVR